MAENCKVSGCKRPYRAKGYCNVHYRGWRQGELPHPRYKTCSKDECRKPVTKKGLCANHLKEVYPKLAPAEASPAAETAAL